MFKNDGWRIYKRAVTAKSVSGPLKGLYSTDLFSKIDMELRMHPNTAQESFDLVWNGVCVCNS